MFPALKRHGDIAFLILRLVIGIIFLYHGWMKLSGLMAGNEMSGIMTILAIAEPLGGLALILGFLTQLASLGLAIIMIGAIYMKMTAFGVGFAGSQATGWEFDLMILAGCIVLLFIGAGKYAVDAMWQR